jgi:hypothetical protein
MTYSASTIPTDDFQAILAAQWDIQEGNVPEPKYYIVNDGSTAIRVDLNRGDALVLKADSPTEEEQPIGAWMYGNRKWRLMLELATKKSRVRLWDLKNEIRRICHSQMHSMTNFQRVQYLNFHENMEEEQNIWQGRITIELVSNAVLLETSND